MRMYFKMIFEAIADSPHDLRPSSKHFQFILIKGAILTQVHAFY